MQVRKAKQQDIIKVAQIYSDVISATEQGLNTVGWIRGIYPTEQTAKDACERGDLFVMEQEGEIVATAVINQIQYDTYKEGDWEYKANDSEIMVLHTLSVSPTAAKQGFGKKFVSFYEEYALENGCNFLRMDTNEKNTIARKMYKSLGYKEIGIIPCEFNGIKGVNLVLLEKKVGE